MLSNLPITPHDPLWKLTAAFRADSRADKLDLVLGVYRDEHGQTPVMDTVHRAETRLAIARASKSYRALSGNAAFNQGVAALLLGADAPRLSDAVVVQTVGGTGALRLLGDMIAAANPRAKLWSTDPGYVNHRPIFAKAGLEVVPYRWQELDGALDIDRVLGDLENAVPGDVVLLHGCCHNPSGIDMDLNGWKAIAQLCDRKDLIPLVDMAYQGFGDGLDPDAAGLRWLVSTLDTVLIATSCSKNMGLYCERTGAAVVVTSNPQHGARAGATLENLARTNYSMPADHGAAVAALVFEDYEAWHVEVEAMRVRLMGLRRKLATRLQQLGAPADVTNLRHHKGMFSMLPLNPAQMARLKDDFAIYGTTSGRINVAGLSSNQIDTLARAVAEVSQHSETMAALKPRRIAPLVLPHD